MKIVEEVIRALGFEYDGEPSNSGAFHGNQETKELAEELHLDDRATVAADEPVPEPPVEEPVKPPEPKLIWSIDEESTNICKECLENAGKSPDTASGAIPLHANCKCKWKEQEAPSSDHDMTELDKLLEMTSTPETNQEDLILPPSSTDSTGSLFNKDVLNKEPVTKSEDLSSVAANVTPVTAQPLWLLHVYPEQGETTAQIREHLDTTADDYGFIQPVVDAFDYVAVSLPASNVGDAIALVQDALSHTVYASIKQANDPIKKVVTINNFPISIEWPKGSIRKYKAGSESKMYADYGYIDKTEGEDGEQIDAYAGPNHNSKIVYKIEQLKADGKTFDEEKYMLGYNSQDEAVQSYLQHMPEERLGKVSDISWDQFLKMVKKEQNTMQPKEADSDMKYDQWRDNVSEDILMQIYEKGLRDVDEITRIVSMHWSSTHPAGDPQIRSWVENDLRDLQTKHVVTKSNHQIDPKRKSAIDQPLFGALEEVENGSCEPFDPDDLVDHVAGSVAFELTPVEVEYIKRHASQDIQAVELLHPDGNPENGFTEDGIYARAVDAVEGDFLGTISKMTDKKYVGDMVNEVANNLGFDNIEATHRKQYKRIVDRVWQHFNSKQSAVIKEDAPEALQGSGSQEKMAMLKEAQPKLELVNMQKKEEGSFLAEMRLPRSSTRHHDARQLNKFLKKVVQEKVQDIADSVASQFGTDSAITVDPDQDEFFPDITDEWVTFEVKLQAVEAPEVPVEAEAEETTRWRPWPSTAAREQKTFIRGRFNLQANQFEIQVGDRPVRNFTSQIAAEEAICKVASITDSHLIVIEMRDFPDRSIEKLVVKAKDNVCLMCDEALSSADKELCRSCLQAAHLELKQDPQFVEAAQIYSDGPAGYNFEIACGSPEEYNRVLAAIRVRVGTIRVLSKDGTYHTVHVAVGGTSEEEAKAALEDILTRHNVSTTAQITEAAMPPKPTEAPPEGSAWVFDPATQSWNAVVKSGF